MGLSGRENIPYYVDSIRSLLSQKGNFEAKIAISACCPSPAWQIQGMNTFREIVSYNYILGNYPLSITFNHTVDKCIEAFGEFDGYLYVDSGISFWDPSNRYDALETLINTHKSGPYAITAAMPSNDDGRQWWGIEYKANEDFIFPVGKTTNMHCQIFSEKWRQAYGKILPDIFASHCMESVFSHMCAAINSRFIITPQVHLLHNHSMDGASIGSRNSDPDRAPMSRIFETGGLLYKTKKEMDDVYRRGKHLGFGIEECKIFWPHDPTCYDENGYAKSPLLKDFLRNEMYLSREEFDYGTIPHQFIKGV